MDLLELKQSLPDPYSYKQMIATNKTNGFRYATQTEAEECFHTQI